MSEGPGGEGKGKVSTPPFFFTSHLHHQSIVSHHRMVCEKCMYLLSFSIFFFSQLSYVHPLHWYFKQVKRNSQKSSRPILGRIRALPLPLLHHLLLLLLLLPPLPPLKQVQVVIVFYQNQNDMHLMAKLLENVRLVNHLSIKMASIVKVVHIRLVSVRFVV
jgi:hypothetical protein